MRSCLPAALPVAEDMSYAAELDSGQGSNASRNLEYSKKMKREPSSEES